MACGSTRDLSAHFAVLVLALHTASAALQLDAGGPAAGPAPGMAGAGAGAALDTPLPPGAALAGRFADFPTLWQYYEALYPSAQLVPSVTSFRGMDQWHEVLFQAPPAPRALLFIAHGCSHAARDWWPPSHACPHCLGLPEEVAQTQQALARGYAVLAMTANNSRADACMDWTSNHRDAVQVIKQFRREQGLEALPLYALGVSVGGGFVLKLPQYLKLDGILSEVLGPTPETYAIHKFPWGPPPVVFVSMDEDPLMAHKISRDAAKLAAAGAPVATVRVAHRAVGPSFFSHRSPTVPPVVSAKVVAALKRLDPPMLDGQGFVTMDPRHTRGPWVQQLVAEVPELAGGRGGGGMTPDHSHVWEEMNLAYANHEIIADFTTAAFLWFESGGAADFEQLLSRYGVPGSGIFGDAADAIPPGWQYNPEKDKARRGRLKLPQKAQQQRQKQQKQKPHEVHEAVVDAASAALHAGKVEVPARDAAAAADAAGKAAGKQQAAQQAAETSSAAPAAATKQPTAAASQQPAPQAALAEQPGELHFRQAEQEPTQPAAVIQLGGGQDPHAAASRGTGTAVAAASLQPVAKPLPSAPAALVDGSTAQRRPVVGATAAVIGGVCASVAATAMALVLYRIRQRRAGFAPLATGEPRPHHHHGGGNHRHSRGGLPVSTAHLPPIPESPMAEADP